MAKKPVGLEAIYSACNENYPNQPNPLQMSALVKFWWVEWAEWVYHIKVLLCTEDKKIE